MRPCIVAITLLLGLVPCKAEELSTNKEAASDRISAKNLLRSASELVAEQNSVYEIWTLPLRHHVSRLQIRIGDFEGARKSALGTAGSHVRGGHHADFAEALAAAGKWQDALDLIGEPPSYEEELTPHDEFEQEEYDRVRLRCVEHLIATGDLNESTQAIPKIVLNTYRGEALRQLAVAYAKLGNHSKSARIFKLALSSSAKVDGYEHAQALWRMAEAQHSLGLEDAAKATMKQLVDAADGLGDWKAEALSKAAVLAAQLNDRGASASLFERAIDAGLRLNTYNNRARSIQLIATAQARMGQIEVAISTAKLIAHNDSDSQQDAFREEALLAVVKAQLTAGNPEGAERTAFAISYFLYYRDRALHAVVEHHLKKGAFAKSLETAGKVDNPMRRASAILKTATAYARKGDTEMAREVAARIELTSESSTPGAFDHAAFDFRQPATWVRNYVEEDAVIRQGSLAEQRVCELAASAMTLAQTLSISPKPNYAELFKDVPSNAAIRALAYSHAASGDAGEAMAWAEQVGSDEKALQSFDREAVNAVQKRFYALVGVAEGLIERPEGE